MCGITTIATTADHERLTEAVIEKMNDSLVHRGPDQHGVRMFRDGAISVGLGHRRLSIIDLNGGRQPISNETGTVWISYNGEIYNHRELRRELESLGHRYQTHSDTETIVHAYEQWGSDCVQRLRGMFAFVIWDTTKRQLFAARDRLGIKPLYYASNSNSLLCASEIKALVAADWHEVSINLPAVPEYLTFGFSAGEQTLFQGVLKLMPGHWMQWKEGKLDIQSYWDVPSASRDKDSNTEEDYVHEFARLFDESVRLRMMSDVPIGVFLSGGLDSSAIAAKMAGQVPGRLKTFSIGFEDPNYSELRFAREMAHSISAEHHEVTLSARDFFRSLPQLIWHEDEPIRFPSSVALFHVAALASEHVKVVLSGEGSDELFAGYDRYWAILLNLKMGSMYEQLTPRWLRHNVVRHLIEKSPLPLKVKKKLAHTFLCLDMRAEEIVFDNFYSIFTDRSHASLFEESVLSAGAKRGSIRWSFRFLPR